MMSVMLPGASRMRTNSSSDIPSSVTTAMTRRLAMYVRTAPLLVEPDVLAAAHVVDRVLVHRPVLHGRPVHVVLLAPAEDGPRGVGLQLAVDLVDDRQPLDLVE